MERDTRVVANIPPPDRFEMPHRSLTVPFQTAVHSRGGWWPTPFSYGRRQRYKAAATRSWTAHVDAHVAIRTISGATGARRAA